MSSKQNCLVTKTEDFVAGIPHSFFLKSIHYKEWIVPTREANLVKDFQNGLIYYDDLKIKIFKVIVIY